jgi:hypothetical protein
MRKTPNGLSVSNTDEGLVKAIRKPCTPVAADGGKSSRLKAGTAGCRAVILAACAALSLVGCPPPTPPTGTLTEFQPNIGRGGRSVAMSVYSGDFTHVAIAATERGGLFQTSDGGNTWSHIDSLPAFRMSDVGFVPPAAPNPRVVIATAPRDANPDNQANHGGIWASSDGGATWTHVFLPGTCGVPPAGGFGIAYVPDNIVYVATDCGLEANQAVGSPGWEQTGNWNLLLGGGVMSVTAQFALSGPNAGAIIIDVCRQGGGHQRSVNSGNTWSPVSAGPDCESPHSISAAPFHPDILFATSSGSCWNGHTALESDDGGSTWPFDLKACSTSGRPAFVVTHTPADQNPDHFDLYYSGRQVTCSLSAANQHCPANTNDSWAFIPNVAGTNLNHDINGIAVSPYIDNCPLYEVSDFGVLKAGGVSAGSPCGNVAAWALISNASAGYGALQLYDIAGQMQFPVSGGGINISGSTTLFIATMDNLEFANAGDGLASWQGFGVEGSFLQVLNNTSLATQVADLRLNLVDFGDPTQWRAQTIVPNNANGTWTNPQPWTAASPPGNRAPSFLVAPHTYVEWTGTTAFDAQPGTGANVLYLTQDNGQSWVPVGNLASNLTPFNRIQVAQTLTGQGPVVYDVVEDANNNKGIAILAHFLPPPGAPGTFEIQTLGGTNDRHSPSGLKGIWGNCFGDGAWYCAPVFSADPNDFTHLYAVDNVQQFVAVSHDAGETWREDIGLTNLVKAGGTPMTDSIGNSQVHVFAFDPNNSMHILVGTDQAGIFASANGGTTWSAVPNTSRATSITSFFFDDRTNTIYVGTYGRGLWKLTLDWTTVH